MASNTGRGPVYSFWYRNAGELREYRHGGHAYLWVQRLGPYVVRTWTNRDGRPIATGWFRV